MSDENSHLALRHRAHRRPHTRHGHRGRSHQRQWLDGLERTVVGVHQGLRVALPAALAAIVTTPQSVSAIAPARPAAGAHEGVAGVHRAPTPAVAKTQ